MNDSVLGEFQLNTFCICFEMIKINKVALIFISLLKSKIGCGSFLCFLVINLEGDPIVSVTIGTVFTLLY